MFMGPLKIAHSHTRPRREGRRDGAALLETCRPGNSDFLKINDSPAGKLAHDIVMNVSRLGLMCEHTCGGLCKSGMHLEIQSYLAGSIPGSRNQKPSCHDKI